MTEKVYEELDNIKAEIEKLRSEYHEKSNLCNSLKRSHDDQIKRIQELNLKLEKQAQELEVKTDEIYAANHSLKDLEYKLKEKENIIKSFSSSNEKLRIDFSSKLKESEEEKRNLLSSLDEANMKISDLEQKNRDFMDKIEVLKEGIVSVSQKKCASETKVAKASKQMRERGDMFEKLEEEKGKLEEQIKWKNEKFKHLEEAHEKLRDNLRIKKKEWDMERSSFLDEISTLETKLDSQITLSEDLKRRLEASNQALAHEQNQRKSQIQDQEASIASSVAKLQKKLKTLEQIHSDCSSQNEVKEAEWRSKMEKMVADLNSCRQEIEKKDICLKKLTTLEQIHNDCSSQWEVKEAEWRSKMEKMVADLNSCRQEIEKKDAHLKKLTNLEQVHNDCSGQWEVKEAEWRSQMEKMVADLNSCKQEIEKKDTHLKKLTTLEQIHNDCSSQWEVKEDEWRSQMEKMTADLNSCRQEIEKKDACLKKLTTLEQIHNDCSSQREVKEAEWRSRMEKTVADLNSCRQQIEKKDIRLKEITKELYDYNSIMLQLTTEKEESAVMIVALKSTLLEARSKIFDLVKSQESLKEQHEEMVEKEKILLHKEMKNVCDLLDMANEELADKCCEVNEVEFELQIWKSIAENLQVSMEVNHRMRREVEDSLLAQVAIEVNLKEENEEKDQRINDLEQKLKESQKNTDTLLRLSKENDEKENLDRIVQEKDQRINDLQKIMESLEEEFDHSSVSFSTRLSKMQCEMNVFHEAWEKIRTNAVVKEIEVEIRDLMIVEMEKDLEKIMLEKDKLMEIIGGVSERINKLSREDGQMMGTLRSIVMSFDEKDRFDPVKENMDVFQSPKRRGVVESSSHDRRSPLRALNS